ncbi:transporter substrate-binding domain-containing protein [Brachybacterium ginsengisoli]|uniref:transporter substrate-binding domain-containing protein n=1 Tax=Brachybacterium ginsengisoli TaxID=1331682 RepID=UPI001D1319CD|nr:transporter substrate-binding domain-containing protein [Brachybacterium ginsengisoli]
MFVGACENEPWTAIGADGSVRGTEAGLIQKFAASIDATIRWEAAAMSDLVTMMKNNELDLVIGGLTDDTPWSDRISPTRPYQEAPDLDGSMKKMVIGVRPGENALQVSLERFLAEDAGEL